MPEILTDAYLLFTFVFKQALIVPKHKEVYFLYPKKIQTQERELIVPILNYGTYLLR